MYFTDSDEANALIATDPLALLIGFMLDQQVTVQKAFEGPLVLRERAGTLDAGRLAATLAEYQAGKRAYKAERRAAGQRA